MSLGFQSDLMVFSPKQWAFTESHIHFEYVFDMFSSTRVLYFAAWIEYDEINHGFALKLCVLHAKTNMLRNQCSLIHAQMTPVNWLFYWIVYRLTDRAEFCGITDLDSPFWYPSIPFFSIIPFTKEVEPRSWHEANETLLVCELFCSDKPCLPWL